ncbi:efflux RND transporter permease subunit [Piscinibacter gummiphilus]|uniref:Efflux pump membrane transporter n=1 Tax=Piscinibacter gummiphilus TaxID=946333 RepID=A0A1W6LE33_9BURK|nr:efflux RND transporter permease subunit [Piscinibacter gummiphilus]ARN22489.1 aminoglycoside/multidrug transporter subunit AcrD [Piscinibacter gummiphilus]ATU67183.1 hydrophobe/amphiphile efflux-1 family RND transporter [Piscinibacter gummiphilus]GLS98074.1 multidrug efflux RND transporter permease subunit [Piscinibacter gummiphilus]
MARFFIDRPIFAWVIAIVIMLAGAVAIHTLPLEQYPDIAPTTISINATYTGASAKTIEDSVTQVIEQRLKGLDRLVSMASTSNSAGTANVRLSFEAGTNPDVAQMQVQNKLQQAMSQLPQAVQAQGVSVTKAGTDLLMVVSLISEDGSMSATDLGDYISSNLQDVISRVDGVGDVNIQGTGYAMRLWLDPAKLNQYGLMPGDVRTAIAAQNTEVSAGQLGALPATSGQQLNATVTARGKLQTVEQFRNVVVKSAADGSVVRVGDVARVELGSDNYTTRARLGGNTASGMVIFLATGANAVGTAKAVKAKLDELSPFFPPGMKAIVSFDTTPFVEISIEGVVHTLLEAMVLVVLIMYLFMQNLRATLIPAIAVPVVLLGTFGILSVFGYSINTLTMFGLVLAIGLLVDDAIVVVENVERLMSEEKLTPLEATRKSMGEITGALVGIALVLSAVFIPMAFFGGSTGVIYRQFSITVVSAMVLSVLVAMTLTPALCATLLHEGDEPGHTDRPGLMGRFFNGFNRFFDRNADRYERGVAGLLKRNARSMLLYALLLGVAAFLYVRLPTSFLPEEDQGTLQVQVRMPAGATDERLKQALSRIETYLSKETDVVRFYNLVSGQGGNQGTGQGYIRLKDWSERTGKGQSAAELARRYTSDLQREIRDAQVFILLPPAVRGLGANAGFSVQLQDVGGIGPQALAAARDQFLDLANSHPELSRVRNNNLVDTPEFNIRIDDRRAGALGLTTGNINDTLSAAMGGSYINDFIDRGRVKKVYMQGDAPFRMDPESYKNWYVRNTTGDMVPFSAFATSGWTFGSPQLTRYNGMSSYELIGDPAPGVSSGTAMRIIEDTMKQMPTGVGYEWAGRSFQERLSGAQAPLLYAASVLFVFLCLAALYESWSVPFSVMLVVPLGVLGALAATTLAGQTNDVYFQVGLLTTVGLSAKNAILIVEFAKALEEQGMALVEATLKAVRQRLRPILMTSLAFGFGVLPLAFSTGAGAGSRRSIGTGVLGGMITATILGIFFVPIFYVVVRKVFGRRKVQPAAPTEATP